jgi:hypothetical protein
MFGRQARKKEFFEALFHSSPITPLYKETPLPNHLTKDERQFFADFEDFAAVVNWWFSDEHVKAPWRLQETSRDSLIVGEGAYGRSFAVFHNQHQLGSVELHASGYRADDRAVWTSVELHSVRLLHFQAIERFLVAIAEHLSDHRSDEYRSIRQQMDRALMGVLWQALHVSEHDFESTDLGEIEVQFRCTSGWYFGRRDCEAFRALKLARA